jgi:hypothetical protein
MNSIVNEKKFIEAKLGLPYASLSQSYLRAETSLTTTSTIPFNLQSANVAAPLVTEKLLNLNDVFVITNVSVGARFIGGNTAPTNQKQLNAEVINYYDKNTFTETTYGANIASLWNANLSWIINRREYVPALSMRNFLFAPITQTATNSFYSTGPATTNAWNSPFTSFLPFEPTVISGRDTLNINVNLNSSVQFTATTFTNTVYATMEVRGYLVTNAKS